MTQATAAPSFILVHPQMGENIGAAARVMGNFGLPDLRARRAARRLAQSARPSRDGGRLARARAVPGWSGPIPTAAAGPVTRLYATTARPRGMEKRVVTGREAMAETRTAMESGEGTGFLFGAERQGLENQDVASADAILTLPVSPDFKSLNLAQAVAVVAYEWASGNPVSVSFTDLNPPAPREEVDRLFEHFETELDRAGFFHPPDKTPLMINNLRSALIRARFTEQEARTFRGAIKALALGRGKARIVRED